MILAISGNCKSKSRCLESLLTSLHTMMGGPRGLCSVLPELDRPRRGAMGTCWIFVLRGLRPLDPNYARHGDLGF